MRAYFDLSLSFKALDMKNKGEIDKNDIAMFLEERHLYVIDKDLRNLMDRFDKNKDGIITYSEYIQEMTPRVISENQLL